MSDQRSRIVSQPQETGVGLLWQTQLIFAVDFLKKHAAPIRLEDLAITSGVESLLSNADMLQSFRAHERVIEDTKTGLFSYKPDFILKTPSDLLSLLRRYSPRGGLQVHKLRESWSGVGPAIEELEREGKVLVTRTQAGALKAVFLDEVGRGRKVDNEFREMWTALKTPANNEDLIMELRSAGLSTSSTSLPPKPLPTTKKKGRKGPGSSNRKFKITNVHLGKEGGVDLSRDYRPAGK